MTCCKCSEVSKHSIMIRKGIIPEDRTNPKTPDKSGVNVIGFCEEHWQKFLTYLAQDAD